ncbi:probable palmitoyltransferase ZDHHC24 [Episyrphus balteatus]|uniref:probable palmitoyltransferase ZDHHC24 n=1 Tax=Episyrphus balteatus TaxID=286459 RepID=UPI0024857C55|nr:probable palmitoyltransferase ZDHHC24 [Episyrphus balteatus]
MLKLRRNILPKRVVDIACFLLIFIFTPITYIFEMTIVLPVFHEFGGFFHTFTMIAALFLIFQIKGNMIACMMVDTSVDSITTKPPTDSDKLKLWHNCDKCDKLVPPRSWHCKVCQNCIIKRDHHCLFTGCCIGHRNHRYFMLFVVYLLIGSTYALVYNSLYLWYVKAALYRNWLTVLRMTCPLLMFVMGSFRSNLTLIIYNLNILAFVYSLLLFVYHGSIIWQGGVCHERGKYKYNLGWRENLKLVFGNNMARVWMSPLIKSDLPHNGLEWQVPNDGKNK